MGNDEDLQELGNKLGEERQSKDTLVKYLKQLSQLLMNVDQSAPPETVEAMKPCKEALVRTEVLRHKDKDVRLLVATCASELMRIEAPENPYDDEIVKELFQLIVSTFDGLDEMDSPSFTKRVYILETVASVKSCILMLDIDADVSSLVFDIFKTFFAKAREDHPPNVLKTMLEIMALVVEESDDIPRNVLEEILRQFTPEKSKKSPAGLQLAGDLICLKLDRLMPHLRSLLSAVGEERSPGWLESSYNDVVFHLYRAAPQLLVTLVPDLNEQLVAEDEAVRLRTVQLLGKLFSIPASPSVVQDCGSLITELTKRCTDKSTDVRVAALDCAVTCCMANPPLPNTADLKTAIESRIRDPEANVRIKAVSAICDLVKNNYKSVTNEMLDNVALRLRDKKQSVRQAALQNLTQLYAHHCSKPSASFTDTHFEWVPGRILKCIGEFRPQGIEMIFTDELFPPTLSMDERAKHWVLMFSKLDHTQRASLERVLALKDRFQREMRNFLAICPKLKQESTSELERKLQLCIQGMTLSLLDSTKEDFTKLQQMKDNNIFKLLSTLLDPGTSYEDARATYSDFVKGFAKGSQHEFLKIVALRCSHLLFGREHFVSVFNVLKKLKAEGNKKLITACLSLLTLFAGVFPFLVEGVEDQIIELLKEDDDAMKEAAVSILSKAGHCIRENLAEKMGDLHLTLEKLCKEGTRKQAKYAVSAIAVISKDAGLKALSFLYSNLLDALDKQTHLPTVLQSLGCIAQTAMPVYETRESDVVKFIVEDLLRRNTLEEHGKKKNTSSWGHRTDVCQLKIFGLKTLVKSYLPNKDPHLRKNLKDFLPILFKLLRVGEINDEIQSSAVDKAHGRLAAAKAFLRLFRVWDREIPPDMFNHIVLTAQDSFLEVRQGLLLKTHQYLKSQQLPPKFACVFCVASSDSNKEAVTDAKRYISEFVESCRRNHKPEGFQHFPEYVLTYLVHVLAHHPQFPDSSSSNAGVYEPFVRQLYSFLNALLDVNNLSAILEIFRNIKKTEDVVDSTKSKNLYVLCDIGLHIAKQLGGKRACEPFTGNVPLPIAIYKAHEEATAKVDGSDMPSCLTDEAFAKLYNKVSLKTQKRGNKSTEETSGDDDDDDVPPSKKSRNGDASEGLPKRKRGRPSKEEQNRSKKADEPAQKKRGRPKGASTKKRKTDDSPTTSMEAKKVSSEDGEKAEENTPKRRKSGAAEKSTNAAGMEDPESLVGRKVKVWWPLDARYYRGTVVSYSSETKKHKIHYSDGDREVLYMDREKWEFVDDPKQTPGSPKSEKPKKRSKSTPQGSSQKAKSASHKKSKEVSKEVSDEGHLQSENEAGRKDKYSKVNGSSRAANGDAVEAESSQRGAAVAGGGGAGSDSEDETLQSYRQRRRRMAAAA